MTQELNTLSEVSRITNAELVCRLERLVKADRALSAKLLVHIGEADARKLYCEHGFESMHKYCMTALRMSDAAAYLRIQAARLGRRFPLVLERLGAGDLHLSGIKLLDSHLSEENHVERLDRARGKTKREIEVLVAEWAPKPDVPARMRKLPDVRAAATTLQSSIAPQVCGTAPTSIAAAHVILAPPSYGFAMVNEGVTDGQTKSLAAMATKHRCTLLRYFTECVRLRVDRSRGFCRSRRLCVDSYAG